MTQLFPNVFAGLSGNVPASELDTNFNLTMPVILGYATAQALTTLTATQFYLSGYRTLNDGGQGIFVYDASDTTTADNGGTVLVDASGHRWKRSFSGRVNVLWFGAKGDASTDNTAAVNAAFATGMDIYFPNVATYICSGQLLMNTSGQQVFGDGRKTILSLRHTGSPQIVVGNATTLTESVSFWSILLISGIAGTTMFQMRYVRGLRFFDCYISADNFVQLGDASLDAATRYAYIFEMYGGCEMHQIGGAQLNFFEALNFGGQFILVEPFFEGCSTVGRNGFSCKNNIHARIDDFEIIGGNFTANDINIDFTDGRVTNARIIGCYVDQSITHGICFDNSAGSSQPVANIGFEMVLIDGCVVDASAGAGIYVGNHRAAGGQNKQSSLQISNLRLTGATQSTTPVVIENLVPTLAVIKDININGITGLYSPTDTSQDVVRLTGGTTAGALSDIQADNINVYASGNVLRSALRIEGSGNLRISHGPNIGGLNVLKRVDDQTGFALRAGWFYGSDTHTYGSIGAGSSFDWATVCEGARVGDYANGDVISGTVPVGIVITYKVTGSDVVTITFANVSAGPLTPGLLTILTRTKPADL